MKPLIPGTIADGKLSVSNSLLKDVATCDTKAYLAWVLRKTIEGEFGPMLLGSALHLALAEYFRGRTRKECMIVFRKAYKAWAVEHIDPNDKFNARLSWPNARLVLKYWLKAHPRSSFPFTVDPNFVEIPFAAPLTKDNTIILRGILDLLVRHKESQKFYILDHKSTGSVNSWWLAQFQLESQIPGYMFGVQAQTDEEVVGGYINAIPVGLLPGMSTPHYKCRTHSVPYAECQPLHVGGDLLHVPVSHERIAMWKRQAIRLATRYKALLELSNVSQAKQQDAIDTIGTQGMFNGACRFCSFRDWCRNGRQAKLIPTMLVDRPMEQEAYYE